MAAVAEGEVEGKEIHGHRRRCLLTLSSIKSDTSGVAVFETWHLGDGNYPPLKVGEAVNLSFEIEPDELALAEHADERFDHLGQAEYSFEGLVLSVYGGDEESDRVVVIEAAGFRFYICSPLTGGLKAGETVSGKGTLVLDHYLWVEFLAQYPNPPELFYKLRVTDVVRARIPERFIGHSGLSTACPTRVSPDQYGPNDLMHVEMVADEPYCSFFVHFTDTDVPPGVVPLTFR